MRKKVFFALVISDFRSKKRFCFKKKKVSSSSISSTPSGYLGLPTIRESPGQPLAHFSACTRWYTIPAPRQKAYSQAERPAQLRTWCALRNLPRKNKN